MKFCDLRQNTISTVILRDENNGEFWEMTNGYTIKAIQNWVYNYTSSDEAYNLTNGVYYSKTEKMSETIIPMTFNVKNNNDYAFKRFINRLGSKLKLEIGINGHVFHIFGNAGNQSANVNNYWSKEYVVEFRCESRPLELLEYIYTGGETIKEGGVYDISIYDEGVYSGDGGNLENWITEFQCGYDTSTYFSIVGVGTGQTVAVRIESLEDDREYTFTTDKVAKNTIFRYSNIPARLEVSINGVQQYQLLNANNKSNFTFNLTGMFRITIFGLANESKLQIWNGYKVI